jgi:hypothetical protein
LIGRRRGRAARGPVRADGRAAGRGSRSSRRGSARAARHTTLTRGYALALALLVAHAYATGDEATKVACELWGRARLTADETAVDAHRTFDILCG